MVSRCFPGGYNVKLYISRGRLAWWLLAFFCAVLGTEYNMAQPTGLISHFTNNTKQIPQKDMLTCIVAS